MDGVLSLPIFTNINWTGQLYYLLAWISFGLGHTLLAGQGPKRALKTTLGPYYRLAYNLFATVHILAVTSLGRLWLGDTLYSAEVGHVAGQAALFIVGSVWFGLSLRSYDLGLLAGTKQIRQPELDEQPLTIDGMHRYVRHPLYAAGFLIFWGAAIDEFGTATALWGSVYLVLGTWAEERRLTARFGETYKDYRRRVPAYVPWKGRAI